MGNKSKRNSNSKQKNGSPQKEKKTNSNVVTIQGGKTAVGINWAAQLKAKKEKTNEAMTKQRMCVDADKVRHVLEVFNMTPADYKRVSGIFKHFKIDSFVNSLICVKQRWFVVFDCYKSAVNATHVVKDKQFKLKRIDLNKSDVQMLKKNVPPPSRSK